MRKLLILALIAVAALVVMGAHYSGGYYDEDQGQGVWEEDGGTLSGTITLLVYQWADITFTLDATVEIKDYDDDISGQVVGSISIDSNAPVAFDISDCTFYEWKGNQWVERTTIPSTVTDNATGVVWVDTNKNGNFDEGNDPYVMWDGNSPSYGNYSEVGSGDYDIYLTFDAFENLPAGAYRLVFEITVSPTVQLP